MRSAFSTSHPEDPAAPFLLTLDRSRAAGVVLPNEPPREQHRLAALFERIFEKQCDGDREVMPEFHGHTFGDTIDKAVAGLTAAGVGKTAVRAAIRAYAWPLLWLRYDGGREKVLFVDRSGEIRSFDGT